MVEPISFDVECLSLEYAKSNRSECKGCDQNIAKDTVRIAHSVYFDPEHLFCNKLWYHLNCFKMPERFRGITFYEMEGSDQLEKKDRDRVMQQLGIAIGDASKVPQYAPIKEELPPLTKHTEQKTFDAQQFRQYKIYEEQALQLNVKDLQALVRKNKMLTGGTKDKLASLIAECKILGARPSYCPNCGGSNIRFSVRGGYYKCTGYLDDIDWYKCDLKIDYGSDHAPRRREWVD